MGRSRGAQSPQARRTGSTKAASTRRNASTDGELGCRGQWGSPRSRRGWHRLQQALHLLYQAVRHPGQGGQPVLRDGREGEAVGEGVCAVRDEDIVLRCARVSTGTWIYLFTTLAVYYFSLQPASARRAYSVGISKVKQSPAKASQRRDTGRKT